MSDDGWRECAKEALAAAEWSGRDRNGESMCPVCGGYRDGFELADFMVYHPGEHRGRKYRQYPHRSGRSDDHTIILDGHAFTCKLGLALGHIKPDSEWEYDLPANLDEYFGGEKSE